MEPPMISPASGITMQPSLIWTSSGTFAFSIARHVFGYSVIFGRVSLLTSCES
jgi:hypothetical protein